MRAMVLIYDGYEVSNEVLTHIMQECVAIGMIKEQSTCNVYQLSESQIAKAIVESTKDTTCEQMSADKLKAIESAIIVIKNYFGDKVNKPSELKMQLLGMCMACKSCPDECSNKAAAVYNAVLVLGSISRIPNVYKMRYSVDDSLLNIIQEVITATRIFE